MLILLKSVYLPFYFKRLFLLTSEEIIEHLSFVPLKKKGINFYTLLKVAKNQIVIWFYYLPKYKFGIPQDGLSY